MRPQSVPRWLALAAALLLIAVATLLPSDMPATGPAKPWCLLCGDRDVADAILNLCLFAPLGIALALQGFRWHRIAVLGLLLSGVIEALQIHIIPGRDASVTDLLTNTLGTMTGAALTAVVPRLYGLPSPSKGRAALGALALAWLAVAGSNVLTIPSLPESQYFGHWNHLLGGRRWEGGKVRSAIVAGLTVPDWQLENSAEIRRALLAGSPIEVSGIAGSPVDRSTAFFQIVDDAQRYIVVLAPDREDFTFRYRMRATAAALDSPDLRLRSALRSISAGDSVRIAAWREGKAYCLRINDNRACGLGYSAAAGWTLLMYPDHWPTWLHMVGGAGWLALLTLPFASLVERRTHLVIGVVALAAALVLSAALIPGIIGPSVLEWFGLPAGAVLGQQLGHMLARSEADGAGRSDAGARTP